MTPIVALPPPLLLGLSPWGGVVTPGGALGLLSGGAGGGSLHPPTSSGLLGVCSFSIASGATPAGGEGRSGEGFITALLDSQCLVPSDALPSAGNLSVAFVPASAAPGLFSLEGTAAWQHLQALATPAFVTAPLAYAIVPPPRIFSLQPSCFSSAGGSLLSIRSEGLGSGGGGVGGDLQCLFSLQGTPVTASPAWVGGAQGSVQCRVPPLVGHDAASAAGSRGSALGSAPLADTPQVWSVWLVRSGAGAGATSLKVPGDGKWGGGGEVMAFPEPILSSVEPSVCSLGGTSRGSSTAALNLTLSFAPSSSSMLAALLSSGRQPAASPLCRLILASSASSSSSSSFTSKGAFLLSSPTSAVLVCPLPAFPSGTAAGEDFTPASLHLSLDNGSSWVAGYAPLTLLPVPLLLQDEHSSSPPPLLSTSGGGVLPISALQVYNTPSLVCLWTLPPPAVGSAAAAGAAAPPLTHTLPAQWVTNSTVFCPAPSTPHPGQARVSLSNDGGHSVSGQYAPAVFLHLPSIHSASPSTAVAEGGELVVLRGTNLLLPGRQQQQQHGGNGSWGGAVGSGLACLWGGHVFTPVTVLGEAEVVCPSPAWPTAPASITLALSAPSSTANFASVPLAFTITPSLHITSFSPPAVDAVKGGWVNVTGGGFTDRLRCVFTYGGARISVGAVLAAVGAAGEGGVEQQEAACLAPPMPASSDHSAPSGSRLLWSLELTTNGRTTRSGFQLAALPRPGLFSVSPGSAFVSSGQDQQQVFHVVLSLAGVSLAALHGGSGSSGLLVCGWWTRGLFMGAVPATLLAAFHAPSYSPLSPPSPLSTVSCSLPPGLSAPGKWAVSVSMDAGAHYADAPPLEVSLLAQPTVHRLIPGALYVGGSSSLAFTALGTNLFAPLATPSGRREEGLLCSIGEDDTFGVGGGCIGAGTVLSNHTLSCVFSACSLRVGLHSVAVVWGGGLGRTVSEQPLTVLSASLLAQSAVDAATGTIPQQQQQQQPPLPPILPASGPFSGGTVVALAPALVASLRASILRQQQQSSSSSSNTTSSTTTLDSCVFGAISAPVQASSNGSYTCTSPSLPRDSSGPPTPGMATPVPLGLSFTTSSREGGLTARLDIPLGLAFLYEDTPTVHSIYPTLLQLPRFSGALSPAQVSVSGAGFRNSPSLGCFLTPLPLPQPGSNATPAPPLPPFAVQALWISPTALLCRIPASLGAQPGFPPSQPYILAVSNGMWWVDGPLHSPELLLLAGGGGGSSSSSNAMSAPPAASPVTLIAPSAARQVSEASGGLLSLWPSVLLSELGGRVVACAAPSPLLPGSAFSSVSGAGTTTGGGGVVCKVSGLGAVSEFEAVRVDDWRAASGGANSTRWCVSCMLPSLGYFMGGEAGGSATSQGALTVSIGEAAASSSSSSTPSIPTVLQLATAPLEFLPRPLITQVSPALTPSHSPVTLTVRGSGFPAGGGLGCRLSLADGSGDGTWGPAGAPPSLVVTADSASVGAGGVSATCTFSSPLPCAPNATLALSLSIDAGSQWLPTGSILQCTVPITLHSVSPAHIPLQQQGGRLHSGAALLTPSAAALAAVGGVSLRGSGFLNTSHLLCRFGTRGAPRPALFMGSGVLRCPLPPPPPLLLPLLLLLRAVARMRA